MELEYISPCLVVLKDLGKIIKKLKELKSIKKEYIKDIIIKIINRAEANSSGIMGSYMLENGRKE